MRNLFQRIGRRLAVIVCLTLFANLLNGYMGLSVAEAADSAELKLDVSSAILIEASTGQVLYEFNADEALPPASMAKMMTEYLAMEKIKSGTIKWTDQVAVTKYPSTIIGSGGMLAEGEQYILEDMFKSMSIFSANDATAVIAEYVGGSQEGFAAMMNDKAKEFGLSNEAHFIDSTGLSRKDLADSGYTPESIQGETLLSARDSAMLAYHIVNDYPETLKYTSVPQAYLKPNDDRYLMTNWNRMLAGWKDFDNLFSKTAYEGLDGLKTGHTDEAGYCFTGTAERNGFRLISVVMGTDSEDERFAQTRKLLDYGFNTFEKKTLFPAKTELDTLKKVNIKKGVETEVSLVTEKGIEFIVKKDAKEDEFKTEAKAASETKLVAPIKKGDVLGSVTMTYDGIKKTVNLIATDEVKKGSWIRLLFRGIKNFFGDIFSGIIGIFD